MATLTGGASAHLMYIRPAARPPRHCSSGRNRMCSLSIEPLPSVECLAESEMATALHCKSGRACNCGGMQMNHHQELANGLSGELELGGGGGVTRISSSTAPQSGTTAPSSPLVRGCIADGDVIIDRVRLGARNVDSPEYDPRHVSIGPYHYRQPHLSWNEHRKEQGLTAVLSVAAAAEATCISELERLRHRARGCYGVEHIGMKSEEFVRMLLLDGCYILACFGAVYPNVGLPADDILAVVRDVFYLAENQVPFFVLEKIVELTTPNSNTALNDIKQYAVDLLNMRGYSMSVLAEPMPTAPGNLLHLLRMHLDPTELGPTGGDEKVTRWRTATDYNMAGVKIKRRDMNASGNARCILDVKLDGGALMIPCLDIDAQTWPLLRNLMALEQQNRRTVRSHVTAYCIFMSQLACEAKDVELLRKKKVIVHSHGNDGEVAKCFADLCKGIHFDIDNREANYLRMTWQEVEKRYQSWWRQSLAWLCLKYFNNPWLTIGLIAAAIGLACGIVQAVYSVLSYKKG